MMSRGTQTVNEISLCIVTLKILFMNTDLKKIICLMSLVKPGKLLHTADIFTVQLLHFWAGQSSNMDKLYVFLLPLKNNSP